MIRRRHLLRCAAALFSAVPMLAGMPAGARQAAPPTSADAPGATRPATAERPNIVFVLLDDLRFDALGFLTPGLKTPNIDRLAREGTYFPNAVVTSSLCSPSRATILTGQTVRNHGIVDNNLSSEAGLTFFPAHLQRAGYQTAFFGKWHMGNDDDAPRPGFDKWVSFKGQGSYFPSTDPARPSTLNVDGKTVPQRGYITDELTGYALDWLQRGRDRTKPFFLYLSHKAVHSDALPAPRHRDRYAGLDIRLPASAADTPENRSGKPLWVQNQRNSWHGAEFPYHSSRSLTAYFRNYYATLSSVDDSVGSIRASLRKAGLERNTLIVFTSDNGFLFGDHGLIDKRNAYEPSVRVPMIAWGPGIVRGAVNQGLVRNLDLAPTFLAAAHVDRPAEMEGTSFLDLARGTLPIVEWRPGDFVYEYYWEWSFPHTPTTFAIERDRVKYIQYHGVWDREELYDLKTDPGEQHNLIDDPARAGELTALRHALYKQLASRSGRHVVPYTERLGTGAVLRRLDGSRAADFPASWYVDPAAAPSLGGALRPPTQADETSPRR